MAPVCTADPIRHSTGPYTLVCAAWDLSVWPMLYSTALVRTAEYTYGMAPFRTADPIRQGTGPYG